MKISAVGMVSGLGFGSEINAAAIRCSYDGFTTNSKNKNISGLVLSQTPYNTNIKGNDRIALMLIDAISELPLKTHSDNIPLYICLDDVFLLESNKEILFTKVNRLLKENKLVNFINIEKSKIFIGGRCGFVIAMQEAQKGLNSIYENVIVVGVGSKLIPKDISYYHSLNRLLHNNNTNGFIPGEAATAVLFKKATRSENEVVITGIGTAKEKATIDTEEVLKGNGLTDAIIQATQSANINTQDIGFRVASISGESYFFDEATLAQTKMLKQKVDKQPLLHPADCIGEVGAAVGGAIIVQTYYAMLKNYAPGDIALCHISNDNEIRGAFIMEYRRKN